MELNLKGRVAVITGAGAVIGEARTDGMASHRSQFEKEPKNALTFEVLSDVGQKVGRAFGLVYEFTEELKRAYNGFNLDIPALNGTPGEWALPVSATYVIDRNGSIVYAYTDADYRDRADPRDVLAVLTRKAVAA